PYSVFYPISTAGKCTCRLTIPTLATRWAAVSHGVWHPTRMEYFIAIKTAARCCKKAPILGHTLSQRGRRQAALPGRLDWPHAQELRYSRSHGSRAAPQTLVGE